MLRSDTQRPVPVLPHAVHEGAFSILIFLKGFGPGGVERIGLRLAEGWRARDQRVDLLVACDSGPMRALGEGLVSLVAPRWPLIGQRAILLRLLVATARQIRTRRPALLFCPGNTYTILAVALKLILGNACPPIVAKVSNDLERPDMHRALRPLYRLWLRLQGRAIDRFAALSEPMAREVARLMQVAPDRVHIVPNPVLTLDDFEEESAQVHHRNKAGRRFVAVGRLEAQKDYPLMLRAFAAARKPDDRLVIHGEGRARPVLEGLVRTLGLTGQVMFAGHCNDIRARMAEHDVLLLTSLYEGQPGAVVEALSMGLGIVATRCCAGMDELLDHGALGTLVDRGDRDGLVRAITAARPDMQDRARARAKARGFTIEAAMPAYAALFATVLGERTTRSARARGWPDGAQLAGVRH